MEVIKNFSVLPYIINSRIIGQGTTAVCFLKDGIVFKCFKEPRWANERFKDRLPKMDGISNDTFIGPEKLLYVNKKVRGYFYPYVEGEVLDRISGDIKLFELFKGYDSLLKDTKLISDKGFRLQDVNEGSIIINNGIKIIDIDRGYFEDSDKTYDNNAFIIFQTMLENLFIPSEVNITSKEAKLDEYLNTISKGEIDSINGFLDLISNLCDEENPKIKDIRKKIPVSKIFFERHSRY